VVVEHHLADVLALGIVLVVVGEAGAGHAEVMREDGQGHGAGLGDAVIGALRGLDHLCCRNGLPGDVREQRPELAHRIQAFADDVPDTEAAFDAARQRRGDEDIDGVRCKQHVDSNPPFIG
jgi:hypothetical protein